MKTLLLVFGLLLSLLACKSTTDPVDPLDETGKPTEVGQPLGPATSQSIGPAGGTLRTADGKLTLTIPAGALSQETRITARPVENKAPNGVGTGYEFGPDGTQFAKPVTLTYHYTDDELLGATPEALAVAFQNTDRIWMLARSATVNRPARTITTTITHFSWWSLVTEFRLDPEQDTLYIGQTKTLKLMHLAAFTKLPNEGGSQDDELLAPLNDVVALRTQVRQATLNGQDALQSTQMGPDGLLLYDTGPNAQFSYQAPHDKSPVLNPVAIGVTLQHGGRAQLMLVSNLFVKAPNNFYLDGQPFTNTRADGTFVGGELLLSVLAEGVSDPTKVSFLMISLKGFRVGSFPFQVNQTFVGGTNGLSEKSGESEYYKCRVKTAESGNVIIESIKRVNGQTVAHFKVSGKVVVAHEEDEKCQVIKHETMSVSGEFDALIHQ
jgi:hypothetical protein